MKQKTVQEISMTFNMSHLNLINNIMTKMDGSIHTKKIYTYINNIIWNRNHSYNIMLLTKIQMLQQKILLGTYIWVKYHHPLLRN